MLKRLNTAILPYVLLISLGLCATLLLQQQNLKKINLEQHQDYEQQKTFIEANLNIFKQAPAFGFSNLIADWVFLRFVQYYGDNEARDEIGNTVIPSFFETIVQHDPKFIEAHLMLSTATTVYAGQPEKTVKNLEKALTHLSPKIHQNSHFAWSYKGKDEMLFLNRIDEAKHSYAMAAKWVQKSNINDEAKQEISNRYLGTVSFLADNPDSTEARIGAWVMLLSNVQDKETRQRIIKEIEELGANVNITPKEK
ncbi:hypothetical protein [Dactylococcopsis salina]|uniref:Uncharacterized protein n=1 Tax=Dactylococcopsis salina (strain PCC 8305) TaxID=13035 RepID=K9YXE3_DACS8|nr:hypothetical protein [Dactylococcopsis salina]AFZ51005.1 hypothetical protein Dacsa_2400 [Dactylococcopsis salina PCC 8305]